MSSLINKIPLEKATKWANRVVEILKPHCQRIEIAGSIRRKKVEIGDIEIVCIPNRDVDMLGEIIGVSAGFTAEIDKWQSIKGDSNGRYTQRILPNTNGFTVDIFMADADNWGWIFALRTGSAIYAQKKLLRALRAVDCFADGGYIYDFSDTLNPTKISLPEESDLYKLLGIEFDIPEKRDMDEW